MKTIELRRVPYGTTFTAFGDQFVALDYIDGGVLVIRKENWKNAAFDSNGVNDLRSASVSREMEEYLNALKDGGAKDDDILTMTIDLKATDGTREYGFHKTKIGLLTLEQYGKYQHIIPEVDDWWWLATPWRTPGEKYGDSARAWFCYSNGYANHNYAFRTCDLRFALLLSSSLLTSIEDEAEQNGGKTEAETYAEYRAYVKNWAEYANEEEDPGASPLTYEEWKEENAE